MLKIVGKAMDIRTGTTVVYGQMTVSEYLSLIGPEFDGFAIQRRREKHKAYQRMSDDIIHGALLPPITLAVKPGIVQEALNALSVGGLRAVAEVLGKPGQVNILDGLQRTHVLNDLDNDGIQFKAGQQIFADFWLESDIKHLVYRIIVLNAGRKPMTMRHQVELLFGTIRDTLEKNIPDLSIFTENETRRRTNPHKFPLDRLATSYHSYILKNPETSRDNLVAQKLMEEDILDSDEAELDDNFKKFSHYLKQYVAMDALVFACYPERNDDTGTPSGLEWFGSDNVMNSFFAAVGQYGINEDRNQRIEDALATLTARLTSASGADEDPMGLAQLQKLSQGINSRKVNVGVEIRKILTNGFKEYFRESGDVGLPECWFRGV